jgi:hypothetical protein
MFNHITINITCFYLCNACRIIIVYNYDGICGVKTT